MATKDNGTTHHGATGCNILSMPDVDQFFSGLIETMIDGLVSGVHEIWEIIKESGLFDSIDSSILEEVEDESKKLWDQLTDPDHVKRDHPRLYNNLAAGWNVTLNRATIAGLIRRDDWDDGEGTRKVDFEHFDFKELLDLVHNVINVKIMHGCMPIKCVAAIAPPANTCVQAYAQFTTKKKTDPDPFVYSSCATQVLNFVINLPEACHKCLYGIVHTIQLLDTDDEHNNQSTWEDIKKEFLDEGEDEDEDEDAKDPKSNGTKHSFWDKVEHKFTGNWDKDDDDRKNGSKKNGGKKHGKRGQFMDVPAWLSILEAMI